MAIEATQAVCALASNCPRKVGTDKKSQEEVITEKNSKRKQIEMLNRVRSYLNTLDESEVLSKEEINQGMMDVLNHKIKRLKIMNSKL